MFWICILDVRVLRAAVLCLGSGLWLGVVGWKDRGRVVLGFKLSGCRARWLSSEGG